MVFVESDVGLTGDGLQESAFDFAPGHVASVQDPAFTVAAFPAQVQLASAVLTGGFAFGESDAEFDEFGDSCGAIFDDGADDLGFTEAGSCGEGVADVEFERIFRAGDGGDAALGVVGVGFGAILFGDDGDAAVRGDLEREHQAGDTAAEDEVIVLFHAWELVGVDERSDPVVMGCFWVAYSWSLSMSLVFPMNTARAM